jgi:hypothetical protein
MMSQHLLKNLLAVENFLSDETKWTQKTFARNKDGKPVSPCNPQAESWCLLGTIQRVVDEDQAQQVINALDAAIPASSVKRRYWKSPSFHLSEFNDDNDFQTVKRLISVAIWHTRFKPC